MLGETIQVLIVEDENAHIQSITRCLERSDSLFDIHIAPDLQSCRAHLASQAPDVILLDLKLPDGNALDLLKEIGPSSSYPILVMTAGGSEALAVEALKSGAIDYIVKSSENFADMERHIKRALRERRAREEHRQAVQALQDSEEKYRQLFQEFNGLLDAVPDFFMLLDTDLSLVWANHATIKLFDKPLESLIGQRCHSLWCLEEEPCALCSAQQALQTGQLANNMVTLPDGRILESRALPLHDSTGAVTRVISMKRDVSEQKRLQDEAARASRLAVLGELSAGVAHEINNPNALILYNSELLEGIFKDLQPYLDQAIPKDSKLQFGGLERTELMTETPQLFSSMHDAAKRIKRIVNDLRDFSRQDLHDQHAAVDLNQVAKTAARLVGNSMKQATNYFALDLEADLPHCNGAQGRLEQVVINLLINAIQALDNRDQKITLSTGCSSERDQLKLTVRDEGQGMTAEVLDHIFEPFVTTKLHQDGSGLGLSVSSRIVKEHHGSLSFTSTPGKGTTATLTLPPSQEEHHEF